MVLIYYWNLFILQIFNDKTTFYYMINVTKYILINNNVLNQFFLILKSNAKLLWTLGK